MEHLDYYDEFLNERITWKDVKKYGTYAIIAMILGYTFIPKDYKTKLISKAVKRLASNKVENFEVIQNDSVLNVAIGDVIQKIENSKNISNKDSIINRLKNVKFKLLGNTFLFQKKGVQMIYYYDSITDKDYILVTDESDVNNKMAIIHELNHLIDQHRKDIKEVDLQNLITDITKDKFLDFFKGYPDLDRNEIIKFFKDVEDWLPKEDKISFGEFCYSYIESDKEYYLKDKEIYARLSVLKSSLVQIGLIKINEDITPEIIKEFSVILRSYLLNEDMKSFRLVRFIDNTDFLMYLPLIDYDKLDDLNLIARVNGENENDLA